MPETKAPTKAQDTNMSSVSAKILGAFTDAVAVDAELPGVGERLKKTLLEDLDFSEAALRQALFGDASL